MIEKIKSKKSSRALGADKTIGTYAPQGAAVKTSGKVMAFWISFLAAFVVLSIALVPVMGAIMEYRPLAGVNGTGEEGEDGEETELVVLEEDFTDYFVPSNSPFYAAFRDKKRVNCMLLGVKSGLSDVIMLVSFDLDARHVDIVSIPRDTYYYRKGYDNDAEKKINAAYRKDPLNSARAVSDILLGMPINYYAVIEYDGVEKIVDEIGGVSVDIPIDMNYDDPKDDPPLHIHFKKGVQTLNGEDAVRFLRFRKNNKSDGGGGYPDQDIGRNRSQQEFMKSAFKQALRSDLPKLAAIVRENVTSDMPMSKMLYLAQKAMGMSADSISTYSMPFTEIDTYVHPDVAKIEEMIREIYSVDPGPTVPKDAVAAAVAAAVSVKNAAEGNGESQSR
jgi:LCP family protein required for cell wall assembly